jgi:cell division protein FtsB
VPPGESSLKRKALSLALFLILVSSLLNALFGDHGFIELLKSHERLETLEREVAAIETENRELLADIRSLKTSPLAIERLAREQLGLVRPGEIILVIRKPQDPP